MKAGRLQVLIVDDNPADVILLQHALESQAECVFQVIGHGDVALEFVRHGGLAGSDRFWPDLIVLDLNLPGHDGVEVLEEIRGAPHFQQTPVAVVSSSPRDVLRRKTSHADCYITKPLDLDEFLAIGQEILAGYQAAMNKRSDAQHRDPLV